MSKKQSAPKKLKKVATSKIQKEQEAEVKRQREIVSNVLYPFLVKNTKNIIEAKRLCHEVQSALSQSFQTLVAQEQTRLSNVEAGTLAITDITKKGDEFKVNRDLYALFAKEKVSVANALIGGMSQALDSFVNQELSERELKTLKTHFL